MIGGWLIAFLGILGVLAYQRASIIIWGIAFGLYLIALTELSHLSLVSASIIWVLFLSIFSLFSIPLLRLRVLTNPILKVYQTMMPTMSRTEREALSAGTVGWEGDLFAGAPDWEKFMRLSKPVLTAEEKAFLEGPVEALCGMTDDWDITFKRYDLPKPMWDFLKREGFFALIIPKHYGGKGFSAYAHSQILTKVYGRSVTVGSTIAVPNSLGPAELLLHYGTEDQKNYYLPRLAIGEEVPCFALTGKSAGSDAGAMTDKGIVCWGEHQGQKVLGIRLNFDKRYITLAPIATVIGLAFKLYDPDGLIGQKKYIGITCALVPRETKGVTIGRRHFPANAVFQNGPIQGKDVFIPLDWIIGGEKMAGQGWRMLMECLAAGRAISLPASSLGGAKAFSLATGAYARIRRQFSLPIGRFEGVESALAKIAGYTYIMDAARTLTLGEIDGGAQPSVATAILKYHVTEFGRQVINEAMDIHGGKGICLGPHNYLGRFYQSIPIAITVEGANILTRNMIIFGQGVMRCHPFVFKEYEAAKMKDPKAALKAFDAVFFKHMGFVFCNIFRALILSLTQGRVVKTPAVKTKRYFQQATRFSSALALLADIALLIFGGSLKRKESISARLGDLLSYLYLLTAILKHHQEEGALESDQPLVDWTAEWCLYEIQTKIDEILHNFPNRWLGLILRGILLPYGKRFAKPSDELTHDVAQLLLTPSDVRDRLTDGVYKTASPNNMIALLEETLLKVIDAESVEKILKEAGKNNFIVAETLLDQAEEAYAKKIISADQLKMIVEAEEARLKVINVDDFAPEELVH